ncbi:MAG: DNA-3-methyladenine glycosylase family protein [Candidatus Hodarchaeota archaeon]
MTLKIQGPAGYKLLSSVHSWIYPDIQPVPEITTSTYFGRILSFDDSSCPVIIEQRSPGERLHVEFDSECVSKQEVSRKVRWILGLDIDMIPALDEMSQNPIISHIVDLARGIHPYLADTLFEALIKTVIQQQISYRAANVITKRLIHQANESRTINGICLYAFPDIKFILDLKIPGLKSIGLGYKAEYIHGICSALSRGDLLLDDFIEADYDEISSTLLPLRGIGEWTVQTFMIAGLGSAKVFPYGDLGMQNLIGHLFNNGERVSQKAVEKLSEKWGSQGPLVLYLLMCADVLGLLTTSTKPKTHKR